MAEGADTAAFVQEGESLLASMGLQFSQKPECDFTGELDWTDAMLEIFPLAVLSVRSSPVRNTVVCWSLSRDCETPEAEMASRAG